jgi:hypothetical protein
MSDAKLRDLERRWKETGSVEDEAAYLRERLRMIERTCAARARPRFANEADRWTTEGPKILSAENVAALRAVEASGGDGLIIEHRFYRGASAPSITVLGCVDELLDYVQEHAFAGDSIWVWSHSALCRDDNVLAHGKVEDDQGRTPLGGAY